MSKTIVTLNDSSYRMEMYTEYGDLAGVCEGGSYDNFTENISTLDDWFSFLREKGELEIVDNRIDPEIDSIMQAKVDRQKVLEDREMLLEGKFEGPEHFVEVMSPYYETRRITLIRELRDRFGLSLVEAKELV